MKNVAGYNSRRIRAVVSDQFNGIATLSYYTKRGVFPTNMEVGEKMVERIELARQMGTRGRYTVDYLYFTECEADSSTEHCETNIYNGDTTTSEYYYRTIEMFWECLGGVLVLQMECGSQYNECGYNSTISCCDKLFAEVMFGLYVPEVQMDTAQGEITQDSHQAGNTIITRDNDEVVKEEEGVTTTTLQQICSTEKELEFDSIVNRWMALDTLQVSVVDSFNKMIKVYNLPKFLYTESFAPNLMPFQNFMYGNYNIEFRFVVNANKFHVGKVVCAVKYDSYQIDGIRNDVVSLLARPHIVLDLSANNEGVLSVPFKYHRTYVRNASASSSNWGVKDAQYATVNVAILSQLRAVSGAPTSINIRPYYRIKQAHFTGMSYGVPVVQMESALGALVLEEGLKYVGTILNKDKPIDLERQAQYVPKPRLNFSTGKGASDVNPIKLDPTTMTTFLADHNFPEDPVTTVDIARIWGLAGKFEWSVDNKEGATLYTMPIDPTWRLTSDYSGVPTPLEYISSMYQFWSGPLEIRLDFVSNAFHTGSLIISAEFGRECKSILQASSTYTKTFHLGEQRTVSFVIPYIYDTVWRRTQCVPFCPIQTGLAGGNYGHNALLRTMSSILTVRVVNALVPVTSVTQVIDVLVFVRAGSNFTLHSPIMANLLNAEMTYTLDNFPGSYGTSVFGQVFSQFTPAILEGKTGKELRAYWRDDLDKKYWGRNDWDIKKQIRENEQPGNESGVTALPTPEALVQELPEKLPTPEAQVSEKPAEVSIHPKLDKFRKRHIGYTTGYTSEMIKFQGWDQDRLKFSYASFPTSVCDLDSETVYVSKIHQWVTFKDLENQWKGFHHQRIMHFLMTFVVPVTQMDKGNELDVDPTETFNQGVQRSNIQTIESHINIKDLLRRPVQIVSNQEVPSFTGANYYYIPCMPPSHMMALLTGNQGNRIYAPNLGRSYHVHINDMFRFWRGCQRWTFVVYGSQTPVYISYIPHSGCRLVGTLDANNITGTTAPVGSYGIGTEILVPSVNPTHVVETPYDMEENWALMQEEQPTRNYTWRDKGDTNSGHLVLWSREKFSYDLWWAAGDDFKVSNFIGIPPCINGLQQYYFSDNYPMITYATTQMDCMGSVLSSTAKSIGISAMCTTLPHLGSAYVINQTCSKANTAVDKLLSTSDEMATQITNLLESLAAKFSWTANLISWMTDTIYDLILCFVNRNVTTFAVTLLRVMGRLFSLSLAHLMRYSQVLFELFSGGIATQANTPKELISGPYWTESKIGKLLGVVIGVIGLSTGTSYGPPGAGLISKFVRVFADFKTFAYMNHVIRFISSIFDLIMDCVKWCCSKTNIEVSAIEQLKNRDGLLNDFVMESQMLMDESNLNMFGNPAFKMRFWRNTIRARQIQREIVKLPTNQVSSILAKMCNDVIKKSNEKMCDLRSSPIKYEPFVICISGDTKVGKSTMVRYMVPKLLNAMGIVDYPSDPIFVRMQSSKFWNGYVDQPVILIDEWLNINDPTMLAEAINELYMLKSCATFIPEQAAIEEKKARASPKIVIILCNDAFPKNRLSNVAPHTDAVFRRRDVVAHVQRKPDYKDTNLRELTPEDSKACVHISAKFYTSSINENSLDNKEFSFEEFGDELARMAKKYDEEEIQRVKIQFNILKEQCSSNVGSLDEDPFAIFYNNVITSSRVEDPSILPSEQLEAYIQTLANRIETRYPNAAMEEDVVEDVVEVQGVVDDCIDYAKQCKDWIKQKFIKFLHLPSEVGECAWCKHETVGYAACVGERTATQKHTKQHFLCATCYDLSIKASLYDKVMHTAPKHGDCPLCGKAVYKILPRFTSALMTGLLGWRKKTDFISLLKGKWHSINLENPITYFMITQIVLLLMSTASAFFIMCMENKDKVILVTLNNTEVQMDNPIIADKPVKAHNSFGRQGNSLGGLVEYGFNDDGYNKIKDSLYPAQEHKSIKAFAAEIAPDDCEHTCAKDNMLSIRYENQHFLITADEGWKPLSYIACSAKCLWRTEEFRYEFCSHYFHTHIRDARKFITTLLQSSDSAVVGEIYPPFMLPKWPSSKTALVTIEPNWWERVRIPDVLKKVLGVLGSLTIAFGAIKGLGWLYNKLTTCIGIQAPVPSGDSVIRHFKPKVKHMGRSNLATQSVSVEDSVVEKIIGNYISIYVYSKDGKLQRMLTGVGIKQRIAIIPRHYYNWLVNNQQDYYLKLGRTAVREHQIAYKFDDNDFIVSETSDIAIFYMPASTNMFKNIQKYMFTDGDYEKKRASLGIMVKVPKKDNNTFTKLELDLKGYKPECSVSEEGRLKTFKHLIEYNYSESGACGSLVMCHDHQRPIQAMHIAGSGEGYAGIGYGVLLSQEMLDEIPDDPVTVQADDIEEVEWLGDLEQAKIHLPMESNVEMLGSLPTDKVPFTPYTTKIKPSLISNILPWKPSKEPAILSKKDPRYEHEISPLIAGCAKHGYLTKDFKSGQLEEVRQARMNKLMGLRPIVMDPQRMSPQEAVAGIDHLTFYDTIKLDTSVGWPWCCSNKTLKSSYCQVDKDENGVTQLIKIDKIILDEVERKETMRRNKVVPITVFIDTLKDEKKDKAKISKLGGTRVFCASPFDYTISMRQNYLHFIAAYMYHRHEFDHGVGMNVNGSEITRLVRNLLEKGPYIVTIDYSNFGPGFNAGVAANVKNNIIQWTINNVEGCSVAELSCLFEEGINSVHAMNNLVYRQRGGSPSGSPVTVVINSEVNVQYIYLAWLNLSGCTENVWNEFEDNVALYVYGDDLIMSVSKKYIEKFNGITIQSFFREYDIVSTDASKSAQVKAYESIYEATFLKKNFDHHPIHRLEWIAKTQYDSIYDTPHWIQESVERREATRVNAEACLREAYGHGKDFYEKLAQTINTALRNRKMKPIMVTWEELDRQHYPAYY